MYEKENHESYGLINVSRVTSSVKQTLFGSSIKHSNTIVLRIDEAERVRDLNRYWYHSNKRLVEIELSPTQWADLITSLNMGMGTPCTIRTVQEVTREKCPSTHTRELFEGEFKERIKDISKDINTITEKIEELLTKSGTLTKKERLLILDSIKMMHQEIRSNLPFLQQSFSEQMDKTVSEAKGEIESFIHNAVVQLGKTCLEEKIENKEDVSMIEINDI